VEEVRSSRTRLQDHFGSLGISFWPSQANFVLARIGALHAEFVQKMKARGILVRDRSSDWGCDGCVRITAGWEAHTDRLLAVLPAVLKEIGWAERTSTSA
jgi:histidinol-phosphate aminotransferase